MKHKIYSGLLLLLSLLAFTSCDKEQPKEETKEIPNLIVELSEATLQPSQSLEIPIKSGSGNYMVSIPQIGIAIAKVDTEKVILKGIKIGETQLIITDKDSKQRKEIKVTVVEEPTLKISHRELKTNIGSINIITILNGSSEYDAELSDKELGTFYFDGQNLFFSAKKIGNGTITIKDKKLGYSKTINLSIAPIPLLLSVYDLKIATGDTSKISVNSGSGDYTVTCSKSELVEIKVEKNTISVTAIAVGEGIITIKDNATKFTKEVKLVTTLQPFTTEIDEETEIKIYLYENSKKNIEIYTGNGQYEIEVENESVIKAKMVEEKVIQVSPLQVGESSLTIKDVVSGESVTTRVIVLEALNEITFNTDKVVLQARNQVAIQVTDNKSGLSNGDLTFITADESIATAYKNWWSDDINVYGRKAGHTTLLVVGDDGTVYGVLPIEVQ